MSTVLDRTRRRGQSALRVPFDFYTTPPEATRALLSVEDFDGPIWEPACGNGAISKVLKAHGHSVVSTDLIDRGYGLPGNDFLSAATLSHILTHRPDIKHVVTNPPYGGGMADKFIGRALMLTRQTGGKVAMLLDLASLCHPDRHSKFVSSPPTAIYALDELVCVPNGDRSRIPFMRGAGRRYCWIV